MAALAAISIVGAASASAETIYITGSTAFRSSANTAITTYAANNGGQTLAIDNATLGKAGNLLVSYVKSGATNLIDVHWSGSEGGMQAIAGPTTGSNAATIGFFATNATGTNSSAGSSTSTNNTNFQVAELSFADTYQSTSIFQGVLQGVTYSTVTGYDNGLGIVGVVSFTWEGSKGFPTNGNITPILAQQLLAAGTVPLALITGNVADKTNGVYLIGRNKDSGTRLSAFNETGFGTKNPAVQYLVNSTSNIIPYPVETINGISSVSPGNSGYSSGGTLVGQLTNSLASGANLVVDTNGTTSTYAGTNFLVGYAGTSDANTVTNSGGVELTYSGVAVGTNAIAQGQYSFWSFEHLNYGAAATATAKTLALNLGNLISATPTATLFPNVNVNDLVVGRNTDGGPIYNNY